MGMATLHFPPPPPVPPMTFDEFIADPTGGYGVTTITKRYAGQVVGFGVDTDGFDCVICTYTTEAMHPLPNIESLIQFEFLPKEWFDHDGETLQVGDLVVWFDGRTDEKTILSTARTTFTEYRYFKMPT